MDTKTLHEQFAEKIGVPASVTDSIVDLLAASPSLQDAFAIWTARDQVVDVEVYGHSVRGLMADFGVPAPSAMALLAWVERNPERLLPTLESGYAELRDSRYRPAIADPRAISQRVVSEAGAFSDAGMIGFEMLASVPEVQAAFWRWWATDEITDMRAEGYNMASLMHSPDGKRARHPVQALLTLDWLIKEPERARRHLTG